MTRLKAILVVLVIIGAVFLARHFLRRTEPGRRAGAGAPTPVVVQPAGLRPFADLIQSVGTVSADESVAITSAVSELVEEILFEDGATVQEGDTLARLRSAEEAGAVEAAEAAVEEAARQFERVKILREQDLVPEEELEAARNSLEAAQGLFEAAQARLHDRIITAPFDGVLGIRQASPGMLVSPGTVITTLDDLRAVKIDFTVPEAQLAEVAFGQSITARAAAWADKTFDGKVTSIDSRVDPATRAVAIQARVPNPERLLRTGMFLTVELASRPRESVAVPEQSLLAYADQQYVFVVKDDGTASQRPVRLGARTAGWVEILDGVNEGEAVVIEGAMNLRDGAAVRMSGEAPGDEGPPATPEPPR